MGNVKFALDTGPDATSNSWLKYVRSAPSFEEQNLAACHLTGDQVGDVTAPSWAGSAVQLCVYSRNEGGGEEGRGGVAAPASHRLLEDTALMCVNVCLPLCCSALIMTKEWLYCASAAGPVASALKK